MAMSIEIETTPLVDQPIIPTQTQLAAADGHLNINGPSLIRVPDWIEGALGRYYLYYADHKGLDIKLAYADQLGGPWSPYEPGVLNLRDTPFLQGHPPVPETVDRETLGTPRGPGIPSVLDDCTIPHIASPEVIALADAKCIRLYYHGLDSYAIQNTRVATSTDGLSFASQREVLSPSYLRMFHYLEHWYGLAMPGQIYRSRRGLDDFEAGPTLFVPEMRHAGLWLRGDDLWVFWTRVGDVPERILLSTIDLRKDWRDWKDSEPREVRRPTRAFEGAEQPLQPSLRSSVDHLVNQLRDPYVYVEDNVGYLVYAVAGESGLAIARLEFRD